jgi:hypothetical protein
MNTTDRREPLSKDEAYDLMLGGLKLLDTVFRKSNTTTDVKVHELLRTLIERATEAQNRTLHS